MTQNMIARPGSQSTMRALDATELGQVSGGTLSLLSVLFGGSGSCNPSPCGGSRRHSERHDKDDGGCTPPPPAPVP